MQHREGQRTVLCPQPTALPLPAAVEHWYRPSLPTLPACIVACRFLCRAEAAPAVMAARWAWRAGSSIAIARSDAATERRGCCWHCTSQHACGCCFLTPTFLQPCCLIADPYADALLRLIMLLFPHCWPFCLLHFIYPVLLVAQKESGRHPPMLAPRRALSSLVQARLLFRIRLADPLAPAQQSLHHRRELHRLKQQGLGPAACMGSRPASSRTQMIARRRRRRCGHGCSSGQRQQQQEEGQTQECKMGLAPAACTGSHPASSPILTTQPLKH